MSLNQSYRRSTFIAYYNIRSGSYSKKPDQAVDGIRTENVALVDVERVKLQKILDEIDANKAILQQLQAEIAEFTRDKPNHA